MSIPGDGTPNPNIEEIRVKGQFAQKLRNGHAPLGRSWVLRDKETI
jgi:hypothetical protein